jgi:uncharacterized membrane protein YphA (DoxX/SURF4 family)
MLLLFAPAALAWRYQDRATRPPFIIYGFRWFLGILFTISGLAKLIPGFPNTMGPVNLEFLLAPYGLAPFARFVAVSELGVGLLLLTRRFATIGALALAPMLLSIIVITRALHWRGTPYVVSGFLAVDAVLLLYDIRTLALLVADRNAVPAPPSATALRPQLVWLLTLVTLLAALAVSHITGPGQPAVFVVLAILTGLVVAAWWPSRS